MHAHGIRRLVFMSAFGVGVTRRDTPLLPRIAIRLPLRDIYDDKEVGDEVVLGSGLDWTIVYASMLTDGPASGSVTILPENAKRGVSEKISRADVAAWMVQAASGDQHSRTSVGITG